ncbi:MAG: hypothetical protein KJ645_10420 [Planctomycetes bacterium]|nr:hypothetical protein [Planctomycetota bacterium]
MSMNKLFVFVCFWLVLFPAVAVSDTVKEGKHFRAICHFDDEGIAENLLETAEAIWPVAAGFYGISEKPLKQLMEVHLYDEVEEYEEADQRLTGGRFKRNWAFSSHVDKSAHVVLQPLYPNALMPEIGLPNQTRHLIAHETAHLVRFHACPNYGSHPRWLVDGAADYIGFETLIKNEWSPGLEKDPYISTYMVQGLNLLEAKKLPSVKDILQDKAVTLDFSEVYTAHWLAFQFLMDGSYKAKMKKIMAEAIGMGGGEGFDKRLYKYIEKTFGKKGLEEADNEFTAYIRSFSPEWHEIYGSLGTQGSAWVQLPYTSRNAIAYHNGGTDSDNYTVKGYLKVLPSENAQMNVILGHNETGFISVALGPHFGISVFDYNSQRENAWEKIHSKKIQGFELNQQKSFAISVNKDRLTIEFENQEPMEVSLRGRSMKGGWGLGVQTKSAGIWYDVQQTVKS